MQIEIYTTLNGKFEIGFQKVELTDEEAILVFGNLVSFSSLDDFIKGKSHELIQKCPNFTIRDDKFNISSTFYKVGD